MTRKRQRESRLILVLGGAASGKSQLALDLAGRAGPRAFVATGQALDREMKVRIERHQATRSSDWETAEIPTDIGIWFSNNSNKYQSIIIDCLTLWLSNLKGQRLGDSAIADATANLLLKLTADWFAFRRVKVALNLIRNLNTLTLRIGDVVKIDSDLLGTNHSAAADASGGSKFMVTRTNFPAMGFTCPPYITVEVEEIPSSLTGVRT